MLYICVLSYFDINPNNKQVHIYQYQISQNMDINNLYNIFLLVNKHNKLDLLDMSVRMFYLNRHHNNYFDSL